MKKQNQKEILAKPSDLKLVGSLSPVGKLSSTKSAQSDPQEDTRSKIAMEYIRLYFAAIFTVFIIGYLKNLTVDGYKDLLLAVSGVLSGAMGIMVGFYFKDKIK